MSRSYGKPDDVFVVVAAFREGTVIGPVVTQLRLTFPNVIVVDDGSPDDTARRARHAGAIVVRHPCNLGQGAALQTGITYALQRGARYVATFDADGQHFPADLQRMHRMLIDERADIVLGSRFLGNAIDMPGSRRLLLRAAILMTRLTSGLRLTDAHNGLRIMTASAAYKFRITQNRMAHASEIVDSIARHRLRYCEAPITIRYSEYSLKKGQNMAGSIDILLDLLTGWLVR